MAEPTLNNRHLAAMNWRAPILSGRWARRCYFLGSHPFYEQLFLEEIKSESYRRWALKQFRVARDKDGNTVGYVSWAFVNEEVNARLSKAAESIKAGQLAESPKITKEE